MTRRWKAYYTWGDVWYLVCQVSTQERARERLRRELIALAEADMPAVRGQITGPAYVAKFNFNESGNELVEVMA